jgi:hypothetical protein
MLPINKLDSPVVARAWLPILHAIAANRLALVTFDPSLHAESTPSATWHPDHSDWWTTALGVLGDIHIWTMNWTSLEAGSPSEAEAWA